MKKNILTNTLPSEEVVAEKMPHPVTEMPKTISVGYTACARAISFGGRHDDPYLIYHAGGAEKLNDTALRSEYQDWKKAENGGQPVADAEEFENFLDFLENERGYVQIAAAFEMFEY